jgi:hypothetical protein
MLEWWPRFNTTYKTNVQEILLKVWNGNGLADRRLLYIIASKVDVTIINQNADNFSRNPSQIIYRQVCV